MSAPLRVELSPRQVSFSWPDQRFGLEPVVRCAPESRPLRRWLFGPIRCYGVGTGARASGAGHLVDLFDADTARTAGIDLTAAWERFLLYGMKEYTAAHLFRIKPHVEVHGTECLGTLLGGVDRSTVVRKLFLKAGAERVTIRDGGS